jgi:hypothetical protein
MLTSNVTGISSSAMIRRAEVMKDAGRSECGVLGGR